MKTCTEVFVLLSAATTAQAEFTEHLDFERVNKAMSAICFHVHDHHLSHHPYGSQIDILGDKADYRPCCSGHKKCLPITDPEPDSTMNESDIPDW